MVIEQGHDRAVIVVRRAADEPTVQLATGYQFTWLAGEAETRDAFSLQEWTAPPGLRWVQRHRHRRNDEGFYLLDGDLDFEVEGHRFTAIPGTWVLIPRGTVHTWRNSGQTPTRLLHFFAPGDFGRFFESARTAAIKAQYGLEEVGERPDDGAAPD